MSWKLSDLSEVPHMLNIAARWATRKIFSLLAPPPPRYTVRGGASHEPTLHPAIYRVSPHDSPPKYQLLFVRNRRERHPVLREGRVSTIHHNHERDGMGVGRTFRCVGEGRGWQERNFYNRGMRSLLVLPSQTTQHIFKREWRSKKRDEEMSFPIRYQVIPNIHSFPVLELLTFPKNIYQSKTLYFQYRTAQNVFRSGIP